MSSRTHGVTVIGVGSLIFYGDNDLEVAGSILTTGKWQYWDTGILNTCTRLWLTESEQAAPVDSIKDVVLSSVKVPEFDKHLKKARGHIGWNIVKITIKMKTIVRKPLMIKKDNTKNPKKRHVAQSTGSVEYTDCFLQMGKSPPPMSVLDMTLKNMMGFR